MPQALTIWFQLQRIDDETIAILDRWQAKSNAGATSVPDSFAQTIASADIDARAFEAAALTLSVGPTLTAHPTKAKRVAVREIHHRIYRDFTKLESQRWTHRGRETILGDIEGSIDLLWLTGELRLECPTLADEIDWGLQFLHDSWHAKLQRFLHGFIPPGQGVWVLDPAVFRATVPHRRCPCHRRRS